MPTVIPDGSVLTKVIATGLFYTAPRPRDPSLDIIFDCSGDDRDGNPDQGVLTLAASVYGTWLNLTVFSDPIETLLTFSGKSAFSGVWNATPIEVILSIRAASLDGFVPFASDAKSNWIQWSNIGSLNFTIWKDNVAGQRPLDWKGPVHAIKKLGDKVVAYGENGVSILIPAGTNYGLNTIHRIGLKGKNAIAGDDTRHFFVDKTGVLWKLGKESLDKFDYSEYLSPMNNNLVLSLDILNNLLYICDGSIGYVYNPAQGSLGECPGNITGIATQGGLLYVGSPAPITTKPFEICTDIYDFGTRKNKTIHSLEFGVDLATTLYAAIDYRRDITGNFATTPWVSVSKNGCVHIPAFGREFRIRARTLTYSYFELDYIKINGVAHAY